MSSYVVSKRDIDLLVRAADHYGRLGPIEGSRFRWWRVDENGEYVGWRELDEYAEVLPSHEDWLERVTPSRAGQVLVDANVAGVKGRYPDGGDLPGPNDPYYAEPYVYENPGHILAHGEVFKAIDHYDYQSCDADSWRHSEAFAFCEALREAACRTVPGYADAPWGSRETEVPSEPEVPQTPHERVEALLAETGTDLGSADVAAALVDQDVARGEYKGCSSELELAFAEYERIAGEALGTPR